MNDTGPAKLPGLARVSTGNSALDGWIQAVSERLEVREGARGNPYERVVTVRELTALGLDATQWGRKTGTAISGVMVQAPDGTFTRVPVDAFADEIRKTRLYRDLMLAIDDPARFDGVPDQVKFILLENIADEAAKRGADIQRLDKKIQSATESLAYTVQEVTAAVKGAAAGVRDVSYASANANAATAGKVTQVVARIDNVTINPADILPTVYATLGALQSAVPVGVPGKFYQVAGTPVLLYRWTGSTYTLGGSGTTATVEQRMTATADRVQGAFASYTIRVSTGGAVSGFGLATSEDPTGATTSDFIVQADRFSVMPSYTFSSLAAAPPASPASGNTWYQTDTKISKRYSGGAWVTFTPKLPFGVDTISDYVYLDGGIRVKGTILGGAATDYSTGTGFFAGYVGATYYWRVGDNTKFITWDGTDLIIAGGVKVGSSLTLSEIAAIGLTTAIDIFSVGLSATPTSTTATYTITGDSFVVGNLTSGWSRTQPASSTTATYKSSTTVTATAPGTAVTVGTWSTPIVVAQNGAASTVPGQGQVKGVSFARNAVGSGAVPTGGSFASPNATTVGWSDGVPADDNTALWMSTRIFTSDDAAPQQSVWTTPQKIGTPSLDSRPVFSVLGTTASIGATDATWHVTPATVDIYMAVQAGVNGDFSSGAITGKIKIKGEVGGDSTVPGPRGNVNVTSAGYSAWSSSAATSLVGIYTGGGSNMMMDIVTLYGTGFSETRYWTGAAWVQLTAYIHGNLLVDGTITAGTATFNKAVFSPTTTATYTGGTAVTAASGQVEVVVNLASAIGTPMFCWSCDAGTGRSSSLVCTANSATLPAPPGSVTFRLCVWDSATGTGYSGSVSTLKIWIF